MRGKWLLLCLALGAAGCGAGKAGSAVPAFVLEGLRSPQATSFKLYLDAEGHVTKSVAYVAREAIPDWVHAMADEKMGQGESLEFELEAYADGDRVYEITRRVEGVKVELSVRADRTVKYLEKSIELGALPAAVTLAVQGVSGFVPEAADRKQGPGLDEYGVKGKRNGKPAHLVIDPDGKVVTIYRVLSGRLEVP